MRGRLKWPQCSVRLAIFGEVLHSASNVFKPVSIRRFHEVSDRLSQARAILVAAAAKQIPACHIMYPIRRAFLPKERIFCFVNSVSMGD